MSPLDWRVWNSVQAADSFAHRSRRRLAGSSEQLPDRRERLAMAEASVDLDVI
jgi:hypothetical protein